MTIAARSPTPELPAPVDWALGRIFVDTLLAPLLYAVLPDRVDPRDWMQANRAAVDWLPAGSGESESADDYWFDTIADTGDSGEGVYSLAYLFHGDLWVADPGGELGREPRELQGEPEVFTEAGQLRTRLPRGQLLFVGGDTAYPVADYAQLLSRFAAPVNLAFRRRFAGVAPPPVRPLLGIPGNHDWYDNLDGFNRVFRRRTPGRFAPSPNAAAPIELLGHDLRQEASYFALSLPGGFELWALDAPRDSDLDHRQRAFFHDQPAPKKLVLATPTPGYVGGAEQSWVPRLLEQLPARAQAALCLWYSGDSHQYARYRVERPSVGELTALVSGLGGASLHAPLEGPLVPRHLYPTVREANAAVVGRLASPLYMLRRGGLVKVGAIVGSVLGAAAALHGGEVGSAIDAGFGAHAAPRAWPLVLSSLLACSAWLGLRIRHAGRRLEREARQRPFAERVREIAAPWVGLAAALTAIAQGPARTFASAVIDLLAELLLLLLLPGLSIVLVSGLYRVRPAAVVGTSLLGALLGATLAATAITTAHYADAYFARASQPWLALRSVLAATSAAVAVGVVLPVFGGWVLAGAFWLGAHRTFFSSLAMVDRFRAFVRFRLRVDRRTQESSLTGFVIAVTPPDQKSAARDTPPRARLIDLFTVS